jgi:surface protein
MTIITWKDNNTTETSHRIYRSTDGTNYSLVGTVTSASPATTGTLTFDDGFVFASQPYVSYRVSAVRFQAGSAEEEANSRYFVLFNPAAPTLTMQVDPAIASTLSGASSGAAFKLPLLASGTYNFAVDWGDGTPFDIITSHNQFETTHNYTVTGNRTIRIVGQIDGFAFLGQGDAPKLRQITNWGPLKLTNTGGYFWGCANLTTIPTASPDLTATGNIITNLSNTFRDCALFNSANVNRWVLPTAAGLNVNMQGFLRGALIFNQPLSALNTSRVTNFSECFYSARAFNQALSAWSTAAATNLSYMFYDARAFNQNIAGWNTAAVTSLAYTFAALETTLSNILFPATFDAPMAFNNGGQALAWNTANVVNMESTFEGATAFNSNITSWDTSKVTNMSSMFQGATAFNQAISRSGNQWNTIGVTNMNRMFAGTTAFNGDISNWQVNNVADLSFMFAGATAFNRNIGGWATGNVANMESALQNASAFNQNIGGWNMTKVAAVSFDLDVNNNQINYRNSAVNMLSNSGLSTANYSSTLQGWAPQTVLSGVRLNAAGRTRNADGTTAFNTLVGKGWTITDGGAA